MVGAVVFGVLVVAAIGYILWCLKKIEEEL